MSTFLILLWNGQCLSSYSFSVCFCWYFSVLSLYIYQTGTHCQKILLSSHSYRIASSNSLHSNSYTVNMLHIYICTFCSFFFIFLSMYFCFVLERIYIISSIKNRCYHYLNGMVHQHSFSKYHTTMFNWWVLLFEYLSPPNHSLWRRHAYIIQRIKITVWYKVLSVICYLFSCIWYLLSVICYSFWPLIMP